jgi:hypothetical protein
VSGRLQNLSNNRLNKSYFITINELTMDFFEIRTRVSESTSIEGCTFVILN